MISGASIFKDNKLLKYEEFYIDITDECNVFLLWE